MPAERPPATVVLVQDRRRTARRVARPAADDPARAARPGGSPGRRSRPRPCPGAALTRVEGRDHEHGLSASPVVAPVEPAETPGSASRSTFATARSRPLSRPRSRSTSRSPRRSLRPLSCSARDREQRRTAGGSRCGSSRPRSRKSSTTCDRTGRCPSGSAPGEALARSSVAGYAVRGSSPAAGLHDPGSDRYRRPDSDRVRTSLACGSRLADGNHRRSRGGEPGGAASGKSRDLPPTAFAGGFAGVLATAFAVACCRGVEPLFGLALASSLWACVLWAALGALRGGCLARDRPSRTGGRERRHEIARHRRPASPWWWACSSSLPAWSRAADGPAQAEIDAAIARGVAFLKERARGERRVDVLASTMTTPWASPRWRAWHCWRTVSSRPTGAIGKAARGRQSRWPERSDQTYDLALAHPVPRARSEGAGGPERRADPPARARDSPAEATAGSGPTPSRSATTRRIGAPSARRRSPFRRGEAGDNSNTQFALLGLWAAGRHGFDSNAALEAIDAHFRGTQRRRRPLGLRARRRRTRRDDVRRADGPGDRRRAARAGRAADRASPRSGAGRRPGVRRRARRPSAATPGADRPAVRHLLPLVARARLRRARAPRPRRLRLVRRGRRELLRRQEVDGGWPDGQLGDDAEHLPRPAVPPQGEPRLRARPRPEAPRRGRSRRPIEPAESEHEPAGSRPGRRETPRSSSQERATRAFPEISVDFEVKRPDGSFLLDATRDDFRVTEEGVERADPPTSRPRRRGRPGRSPSSWSSTAAGAWRRRTGSAA